jgi:hypothetical protein
MRRIYMDLKFIFHHMNLQGSYNKKFVENVEIFRKEETYIIYNSEE